nr:MAG TPA: hypothetical protein [Caudoviricetes sp.]
MIDELFLLTIRKKSKSILSRQSLRLDDGLTLKHYSIQHPATCSVSLMRLRLFTKLSGNVKELSRTFNFRAILLRRNSIVLLETMKGSYRLILLVM